MLTYIECECIWQEGIDFSFARCVPRLVCEYCTCYTCCTCCCCVFVGFWFSVLHAVHLCVSLGLVSAYMCVAEKGHAQNEAKQNEVKQTDVVQGFVFLPLVALTCKFGLVVGVEDWRWVRMM